MSKPHPALARTEAFCQALGLRIPILLAPMAGACPPALSIAIANAGGLGAGGGLLMQPAAITARHFPPFLRSAASSSASTDS